MSFGAQPRAMAVACSVVRVSRIFLTNKARRSNLYLALSFVFSNLDFWVELICLCEQNILELWFNYTLWIVCKVCFTQSLDLILFL